MKKSFLMIGLLGAWISVQADLLTDITDGKFKSKGLSEMTPLDGERYVCLSENNVIAYSYKTGQVTDTLFSMEWVRRSGPNSGKELPKEIEGYVLSPTERYMLVYGNSRQIFRHSFEADYYIFDRKRRELRALSDTMPVMQPVFSPDGKYIAFSRNNNLCIHKLDFKTEVAVTKDGSVGRLLNGIPDWLYEEEFGTTCLYSFSPDSKQLAFVRLDESKVPEMAIMPFGYKRYTPPSYGSTSPMLREELIFRYPCAGETISEASVVVYDTYYKTLKTMALPEQAESYIPRIRWTGGSPATNDKTISEEAKLALFRLNRDQNKLEMFLANPKSTVCSRVYLEESKQYFVDYSQVDEWQFLSDNSFICVNETDGYRHAYLYSQTGQKIKQLTKGRFDVTKVYGYDEKTQTLFYQAAGGIATASKETVCNPMNRYIYALDTKKNKLQTYSQVDGMHEAVFSPSYAYFVETFQSVSHPAVYTVYDRKGNALRVLEDNEDVADKARAAGLPVKEFFSFVTPRGDTLNGWMLVPKAVKVRRLEKNDATWTHSSVSGAATSLSLGEEFEREGSNLWEEFPRKYPVLLFHYSGPASQQVLNRWRISWEEYLAAKEGVICVCIDPRGTDGRGRAFRNETYMHLGVKEAEDQVYVAQFLQTLPYVDSERIGIWGWSYGGYATIRAMSICGIQPELFQSGSSDVSLESVTSPFKFGMAVAPVTDWRFYDAAYTERYMRRPQVNEDGYEDASAVKHAGALQGNLLIIHGLADDNVHARNTLLYTEALVQANRQFEMQIYPDDNHFLRKRNNQRHVYERLLKFLREQIEGVR